MLWAEAIAATVPSGGAHDSFNRCRDIRACHLAEPGPQAALDGNLEGIRLANHPAPIQADQLVEPVALDLGKQSVAMACQESAPLRRSGAFLRLHCPALTWYQPAGQALGDDHEHPVATAAKQCRRTGARFASDRLAGWLALDGGSKPSVGGPGCHDPRRLARRSPGPASVGITNCVTTACSSRSPLSHLRFFRPVGAARFGVAFNFSSWRSSSRPMPPCSR